MTSSMPKKSPLESHAVLLDARISLGARRRLMTEICRTESPEAAKTVEAVLKAATGGDGKEAYREKTKELDALIEELRNGPQRPGVFIDAPPSSGAEARVRRVGGLHIVIGHVNREPPSFHTRSMSWPRRCLSSAGRA